MRKSSWLVVGIICALAAALVYLQLSGWQRPSDEDQIQMLMAKGQSAIERKDLNGMMSCVSKDYSDSVFTYNTLRLQALEAARAEGRYDVLLKHTSVEVQGDTAVASTRVTVALVSDHGGMHDLLDSRITLRFKKERGKRFLVIPTRTWKVTSISGLIHQIGDRSR